ncbi:unnamed protein product [Calypogeia fissa]
MEPIRVFNPLQDLLKISKEIHDRMEQTSQCESDSTGNDDDSVNDILEYSVGRLCGDYNRDLKLPALEALENLASTSNVNIKSRIVDQTGSLTGLLLLLADDNNPGLQTHSARIIRHLAGGDHKTKMKLVWHPGALHGLVDSFSKEANPSLRQETVWALSLLAAGDSIEIKFKIVAARFVLKGLITLLEDKSDPDLHSKAMSAWRNLEAGGSRIRPWMVLSVLEYDVVNFGRQWVLKEIPPEGDCFHGLGSYLLDLEEEEEERGERSEGAMGDGKQGGEGNPIGPMKAGKKRDVDMEAGSLEDGDHKDDSIGCCSFYYEILGSGQRGLWPPSWTSGKKVAPLPQPNAENATDCVTPSKRLKGDGANHRFPLEVYLKSLYKDLESKDHRQLQKTLQDLCDVTRAPVDAKTASYIAEHPDEGLMDLVSIFASPSLRGLAGLALKNLAANDKGIKVTIVGLLISLISIRNRQQESAAWGLGYLATGSDGVKDEIVCQLGALKSLAAILGQDHTNCSLPALISVLFRNLAAAGDCKLKAKVFQLPGVVDWLVSSLNEGLNDLSLDESQVLNEQVEKALTVYGFAAFKEDEDGNITKLLNQRDEELPRPVVLSPILQQNAALALGNLAGGDQQTKAKIVDHPRALMGLVLALGKVAYPVLQQNASFALANMAAAEGQQKAKLIGHPGILEGLLQALKRYHYPILQQNAAFALGCFACGDERIRSKIVDHPGALEALLLSLNQKSNPALQKNVAWMLCILASSKDESTKLKIVNHPEALEGLMICAVSLDNVGMRRYLSWAFANLTDAGNVRSIEKTRLCHHLWNVFSNPVWRNPAKPFYSSKGLQLYERLRATLEESEDYVRFGYTSQVQQKTISPHEKLLEFFDCNISSEFQGWDLNNFLDKTHDLWITVLISLLGDIKPFQNGGILQRHDIRDLCDYITSYQHIPRALLHHRLLPCSYIADYPKLLDQLGIVLSEDFNPHLQEKAGFTLYILASEDSRGNNAVIKMVDNKAVMEGLAHCLTRDANPLLQETTVKILGLLASLDNLKVATQPGIVPGLVMIMTKDHLPSGQTDAYKVLRSLTHSQKCDCEAAEKIVTQLTLLLNAGNSIGFQYSAFSILMHLAWRSGGAIATKIIQLHPWIVDSIVHTLRSGLGLHFLENDLMGMDPRLIPASILENLAAGDNVQTRIKLASHLGVIRELMNDLRKDEDPDLQAGAAVALSRLADSDAETRGKIVNYPGALAELTRQLLGHHGDRPLLRRTSARILMHLARGGVQMKAKIVNHPGALNALVNAMTTIESPLLQTYAAKALCFLANGDAETKAKIVYLPDALEQIVKILAADTGNYQDQLGEYLALNHALVRLAYAEEQQKLLQVADGLVEKLQKLSTIREDTARWMETKERKVGPRASLNHKVDRPTKRYVCN